MYVYVCLSACVSIQYKDDTLQVLEIPLWR